VKTRRVFVLRGGARVEACREAGQETWNGQRWIGCRFTVKYVPRQPGGDLEVGQLHGGDCWRDIFVRLRAELVKNGEPTGRWEGRSLVLGSRPWRGKFRVVKGGAGD
jgi:hypothetical protein